MMTKMKMFPATVLVYLLMIPLGAIMLMSFDSNEGHEEIAHLSEDKSAQHPPDISPVDLTKVTKVVLFGEVIDPRTNKLKNHTGIDFELSKGSDVVATADGVVIVQSHGEKPGNYIVIQHDETFVTRYYHLETALVKHGDRVKRGEVIGLVGNTGLSTIPHLHYEILKNDTEVDPKDYLPELPRL